MRRIDSIEALETLYGAASPKSLSKVQRRLTPLYRGWIEASRFVVLATVGPDGTDASPRGDDGPVVTVESDETLLLPDWKGNNRLDSLRNIVADGRVSLMFMVPGSVNVVRVNGTAVLTDDAALRARLAKGDIRPATVAVVTVSEVYFQCAKAIMRSGLWARDDADRVASAGAFLREAEGGYFDAEAYDKGYADHAKPRMW